VSEWRKVVLTCRCPAVLPAAAAPVTEVAFVEGVGGARQLFVMRAYAPTGSLKDLVSEPPPH
jgi:hypothetical protein